MIEIKISPSYRNNHDPRRRFEWEVARMIQEDQNAMANLSPRFIHRTFDEDAEVERLKMYG